MANYRAREEGVGLAKTKIFFWILAFLLVVAVGVFSYFKYFPQTPSPLPDPVPPKKLINAGEKIIEIQSIEAALSESYFEGGFLVFLPMEKRGGRDYYLSTEEFFLASNLKPPQELLENIVSYNLGAIGRGEGTRSWAFLIFEITSQDTASRGMLAWEKNMPREFETFFPELKIAVASEFHDDFIRNQNTRALESGGGGLFYSIFNKKFLIMAPSRGAMEEILDRYLTFPPN